MHPSQPACIYQQKRIDSYARDSDSYTFFNLLTAPEFLEQVESLLPEHREGAAIPAHRNIVDVPGPGNE